MTTFVLVHGAYHGGWCWRMVEPLLTARGHRVLAPTLTGLGERSHLLTPAVTLDTHVEDVINTFRYEDVEDAVLVGHSYGTLVAAAVADRIPTMIRRLVYLDGPVPIDGEAAVDVHPRGHEFAARVVEVDGVAVMPTPSAEALGIGDAKLRRWVEEKMTPQPHNCSTTPLSLSGAYLDLPRSYVLCGGYAADQRAYLSRVTEDEDFEMLTLDTGHDAMVADPKLLADTLHSIADRAGGRGEEAL